MAEKLPDLENSGFQNIKRLEKDVPIHSTNQTYVVKKGNLARRVIKGIIVTDSFFWGGEGTLSAARSRDNNPNTIMPLHCLWRRDSCRVNKWLI